MNYVEFRYARQLVAEEGIGRDLRAAQQAAQDEEDAVTEASKEALIKLGLVG